MALFYFKGKNALDRLVKGRVQAADELAVVAQLKQENITPIEIRKLHQLKQLLLYIKYLLTSLIPIRKMSLSTCYYQLAGMLSIDIPLRSAVKVIANHLMNRHLAYVLHEVEQQLLRGVPLATAMKKFKRVFKSTLIQLVSLAGSREELIAIFNYSDMSLRRSSFWQRILLILTPSFSFFGLFLALMIFLRERYMTDFRFAIAVFNKKMPDLVLYFEKFTYLFTQQLLWIIVAVVVTLVVFHLLVNSLSFIKRGYHSILYYLPIVGGFVQAIERERLALIMHTMLTGGVTVQKCWEYGIRVIQNKSYQARALRVLASLHEGGSFSAALSQHRLFGSSETQLLVLGEASDNLQESFHRVYEINQLVMKKRIALVTEALRILMLIINLAMFIMLIVVAETIFFYPSS